MNFNAPVVIFIIGLTDASAKSKNQLVQVTAAVMNNERFLWKLTVGTAIYQPSIVIITINKNHFTIRSKALKNAR